MAKPERIVLELTAGLMAVFRIGGRHAHLTIANSTRRRSVAARLEQPARC
jgi:hypothetical protein